MVILSFTLVLACNNTSPSECIEAAEQAGLPSGGGQGTKPSSSTISRPRGESCRCKLSSRLSSRASISGGEAHGHPPLAGGQAQSQGDMGLARAAVADGDDVVPVLYVFAAGQLHHHGLVHRGDGRKVEGVQALDGAEADRPDPALHHALV